MVAAEPLQLTFIFAISLLSTKCGVHGLKESCPKPAVIDLTQETKDFLEFVNESVDVFRSEMVWVEDDKRFGCLCDFKLCVPLCCSEGSALTGNICAENNLTSLITDLDAEELPRDHNVFTIYDSCNSYLYHSCDYLYHSCDSLDNSMREYDFKILPNGSIYIIARSETVDLGGYCLQYEPYSQKYSAVRCISLKWYESLTTYGVCLSISMLFTLASFIVCHITPELENLYGLILRCILASNLAGIFVLLMGEIMMLFLNLTTPADLYLHATTGYAYRYFTSACILWLNVMSYDVWRTFRKFRSRSEVDIKKQQKAKFVRYAIYVLGGSAVYIAIPILCRISGYQFGSSISTWSIMWCWYNLPFLGIGICNTCFYILTALTIRQRKKEAVHLVDGVNKHYHEKEQWFNLYVKLFVIMGGPMILEAVANLLKCKVCTFAIFALDALQVIFMFSVLVWKDDVKRALSKRFYGMQRMMADSYRRN